MDKESDDHNCSKQLHFGNTTELKGPQRPMTQIRSFVPPFNRSAPEALTLPELFVPEVQVGSS